MTAWYLFGARGSIRYVREGRSMGAPLFERRGFSLRMLSHLRDREAEWG